MDTLDHSATAWILTFGRGHIAVGEFEVLHILDEAPQRFPVPQAPAHCHEVILWEGQMVPLLDLNLLAAGPEPSAEQSARQIVTIVGYQSRSSEVPRYGAFLLSSIPAQYAVKDDDASTPPPESKGLDRYTLCSFSHPEFGFVRVLDLPRVFGTRSATHSTSH